MAAYRTQILLLRRKIDNNIVRDLQLAPIKAFVSPAQEETQYDSIQLVDKLLSENRELPELEELRNKARNEKEGTWILQDGLLLRYGKLFVPNSIMMPEMPLYTALIQEVYIQPLMGHPGRAKLRQLLQARYYWSGQGTDIDRYRDNCHTCR
jgi:hypothetical protein